MNKDLQQLLKIPYDRLDEINAVLLDPDSRVVNDFLSVVAKYGSPEEINRKAEQACQLPTLIQRVQEAKPEYLADLEWLETQRDRDAFISHFSGSTGALDYSTYVGGSSEDSRSRLRSSRVNTQG